MTIHDPEAPGWGELAWLIGGAVTTAALVVFIVTGAALGWFG